MSTSQPSSSCCCITVLFLSALVVGGLVGIAIWYCKRPYEPQFSLTSLTLTGLNVSASSHEVGGNWDVRLEIHSRYYKIRYDDLESSILYNGELLSRTVVPSFFQGAHNLSLVDVHHWAINFLLGQRDAIVSNDTLTTLIADLAGGSVGFDVRLRGGIHSDGVWQKLQVLCGVVPVTVLGDGRSGKFNGVPLKCKRNLD